MLPKNKVMLQIPVDKSIANGWKNVVKVSGMKQGDVFALLITELLKQSIEKAKN